MLFPIAPGADSRFVDVAHTDATQAFGKNVDDLRSVRADFVSISSYQIFGPQGIGALVIRERAADADGRGS